MNTGSGWDMNSRTFELELAAGRAGPRAGPGRADFLEFNL